MAAIRRLERTVLSGALISLYALTGCGLAGGPLPMGAGDSLEALADYPEIEQQIAKARLQETAQGTLVKQLPTVGKTKPVTFLTYKALENNLGTTLSDHLNTLEKAGSSQNVNVLAYTDDFGPRNTYRYYVRQDAKPAAVTSPYVPADKRGDMNTGSPEILRRAVKWGFGDYPGQFRWLDINSHGGGYYGIAQDDMAASIIRLPQLAQALKGGSGGRKLDLVSFDACLMATAEVAYELKDAAKVMVASEDASYPLGMDYDKTLAELAKKPVQDAAAMGRTLVLKANRKGDDKRFFTLSAIDLSKADDVASAVDELARALLAAMPQYKSAIQLSLKQVEPFSVSGYDKTDFDHRDLNEVADQLKLRVPDARVQAACQRVDDALFKNGRGAILMSRSAREEKKVPRGLSIYLPLKGQVDPVYKDTSFAAKTQWDEFLAALK